MYNSDDSPRKKIDDLIHLAELCIELLQQDAEHYQEAFQQYHELLIEHEEIFWSLFAVDMEHVIDQQPIESWDSFPLFQLLNDYLRAHGKEVSSASEHAHTTGQSRIAVERTIPSTVAQYVCSVGGSLRRSDGVVHSPIDSQRL